MYMVQSKRIEFGLTQRELSKMIHIPIPTISAIENGNFNKNIKTIKNGLRKLSVLFELSEDELCKPDFSNEERERTSLLNTRKGLLKLKTMKNRVSEKYSENEERIKIIEEDLDLYIEKEEKEKKDDDVSDLVIKCCKMDAELRELHGEQRALLWILETLK